jgi:ABC-2 type transport system ATP-binding protein
MTPVLAVNAVDVTKTYGALRAVDGVSIKVEQGEVYGVLGPNGAGKTTFLRMLFGLIAPDAGTLELFGRSWHRDGMRTLDSVSGFIESPKFYPYLTGRENLVGMARLDGGAETGRIDEALQIVDLAGRDGDRVGGYSFGMRQRLGVAASLLRSPSLLVLDEPANGLDPAGMRDMRSLIKRLAASGLTVLLSSHDMDEVEEICDNVTIMRRGNVAYHGTIAELRTHAPEQGHALHTDYDERALWLASQHPQVTATPGSEGGLVVTGPQDAVTAFVRACVLDGVGVLGLANTQAPLEALFFMLTDDDHPTPLSMIPAKDRRIASQDRRVAP